MSELPRWDLTPIYPAVDSREFLADLDALVSRSRELKAALAEDTLSLVSAVEAYEGILDLQENLDAYASSCLTADTSDAKAIAAVGRIADASLPVKSLEVAMIGYLGKHRSDLAAQTAIDGPLAEYAYVLDELQKKQEHLMSPEREELAADLARSGTDAFSRLQEAVGSSISTTMEDGSVKTVVSLRNEAFNADRAVRKRSFDAEIGLWKQQELACSAALNGVKGTTIALDKARGYSSPLARSLDQSRIDEPILDALIATLERSLPLFRSYLRAKAGYLEIDCCAFHDLFAPVGTTDRRYSYDEAARFIVDRFSSFSPDMGSFAANAFEQRWIDAAPRKGKVGGAYDVAFPLAGQSRILANFDGSYTGMSTLAHELGHAYHDHIMLPMSHLLRTYPMTLAETASIFSEFLVFQGAIEVCSKDERLSLVEQFLQNACSVCVDILCRFYFEKELFALRADHEVTADQCCSLMVDCQKRTYGDALCSYHPYMWAVKGHYYSSDFSFYNYPYAFGQLFALALYAKKDEEPGQFPQSYEKLLSKTGRLGAAEVASSVGCDLSDPAFWQQGMDVIATYVGEFVDGSPR